MRGIAAGAICSDIARVRKLPSRYAARASQLFMVFASTRPACWNVSRPPLNTAKLGMPWTLYRAASAGNFSVSTLSTTALAGQVARYLRNVRRGHAAGTAPRGPEVHQHGNLALAHNLVELGGAGGERLGYGGQRRLARAATAGVGQMLCRYAIRFAARRAVTDDGHTKPLNDEMPQVRNGRSTRLRMWPEGEKRLSSGVKTAAVSAARLARLKPMPFQGPGLTKDRSQRFTQGKP